MEKNRQKGITLIALVITIIVLLILAGITINLTIGQDGILKQAHNAGAEHEKSQLKEELELAILDIKASKLSCGKDMVREDLKELEKIGAIVESIGTPAEGEYKDYFFEIDENYVVAIVGKVKGEKPSIQATLTTTGIVEQGGKVEIKVTASINEGTIQSIKPTNGAVLKTDTSSTEKVFEVSANGIYTFKAKADNGRSAVASVEVNTIIEKPVIEIKDITKTGFTIAVTNNYVEGLITQYKYFVSSSVKSQGTTTKEFAVIGLTEETQYSNIYVEAYIGEQKLTSESKSITTKGEMAEIVWTNDTIANRTIDGQAPTYQNPIIPVGFSAIDTEDAKWNKQTGSSSEWNNGLVIKNATDGNEFVWVPVDGTAVEYKGWCTSGLSYAWCTELASTSGLDIANNVTNYGGFWVARYEAGLPTTISQTDITKRNVKEKPLSIAGAVPWNYIGWNNSKVNAESMYSNDYVQSGLINGTQWDTIMKWVQNGGKNVTNSTNWGNYKNSSVTLRGGKYAYISTNYGETWTSKSSTTNGSEQLIKTGASNNTKANNIYDLAGNLGEWICEKYTKEDTRVARGGYFDVNSEFPAALRQEIYSANNNALYYMRFSCSVVCQINCAKRDGGF